jgi:Domain of unknown function (DUF4333)
MARGMMTRSAWIVVVGGAMALQLGVCAGEGRADPNMIMPDATANYVADFVAKNSPAKIRPTDVSCPSGIEAKVGGEFDCHFTGPDGNYTAHLKILSVVGTRVEYDVTTHKS